MKKVAASANSWFFRRFFAVFASILLVFLSCHNESEVNYKKDSSKITQPISENKTDVYETKIDTITDKMKGIKYLKTSGTTMFTSDSSKAIDISLVRPLKDKSIWMHFICIGAGACSDEGSEINLLFRDNSKGTLHNHSKFNCDKQQIEYFRTVWNNTNELEMLKTKELQAVRLHTNDGAIEVDLTEAQSKKIINDFVAIDKTN